MTKLYRIIIITAGCVLLAALITGISAAVFYLSPRACDTKDVAFAQSTEVTDNTATLYISLLGSKLHYDSYTVKYKEESDGKTYAYLYIYGTYFNKNVVQTDQAGNFVLEIPIKEEAERLIVQGDNSKKTIWIRPAGDE